MDFIHFAGEIMGILSPETQAQITTAKATLYPKLKGPSADR
jgi:hypothetical protein